MATGAQRLLAFDRECRGGDDLILAGVDEAGRGCWAGPVVAAAVVMPADVDLPKVRDSKLLSVARRRMCCDAILKVAGRTQCFETGSNE